MYHRSQHEVQRVLAKLDGIAVFDFQRTFTNAIETLHHLERFLVSDDLDFRIILLDQGNASAMVRLHVIDHQIVDRAVAYHLLNILQVGHEEIHLHRINQTHLLVINQIRVIAHPIGQRPQTLEKVLVTVVHAHVVNLVCNLYHITLNFDL